MTTERLVPDPDDESGSGSDREHPDLPIRSLVSGIDDSRLGSWARIQAERADTLLALADQGEDPIPNLQEALDGYTAALRVWREETKPRDWAMAQANSAALLFRLAKLGVNPIQSLHQALERYDAALRVWGEETDPSDWAAVHMGRGIVFQELAQRGTDPIDSLIEAVKSYAAALRIWNDITHPANAARIQAMLGIAHQRLAELDLNPVLHLQEALVGYAAYFRFWGKDTDPDLWSTVHRNRAEALWGLATRGINSIDNLQEALDGCVAALEVLKEDTDPAGWAGIQMIRANAFASLAREGVNPVHNFQESLTSHAAALRAWNEERHPREWATAQMNRAITLASFAEISIDPIRYLQDALRGNAEALRVLTEDNHPAEWAKLQENRANALINLAIQGAAPISHLRDALTSYGAALRVLTEDMHPAEWASVQVNRAIALVTLAEHGEDPVLNLQDALAGYGAALRVQTQATHPDGWSRLQMERALALAALATYGVDPINTLHEALVCCEHALRVWTEGTHPDKWARVHRNRATVLQNLAERGVDAIDNLHEALSGYATALRFTTEATHPDNWAGIQMERAVALENLAAHGVDPVANLRNALLGYAAALRVRKADTHPHGWARVQMNSGNAFWSLSKCESGMHWFDAVQCYQSAIRVYRRETFPQEFCHACCALGILYFEKNRYEEAFDHFEAALAVTEERRSLLPWAQDRRQLLVENQQLYGLSVLCALQLREQKLALERVEQAKTRNLADVMWRQETMPRGVSEAEWSDYRHQFMELIGLERSIDRLWRDEATPNRVEAERAPLEQLNQLRAALKLKEQQFRQRDPDYGPMVQPLTFDEMLRLAEELDVVIVDFWVNPHGTAVFLIGADDADITSDQVVWIHDWTLQRQTNLVKQWLRNYRFWKYQTDVDDADWPRWMEQMLSGLYIDLLRPVHERIAKRYGNPKRLILVPTKGLALLPLHACWWDDLDGNHYYFGTTFEISYVPSLKILQRCVAREKEPPLEKLVAIENPNPKRYLYFAPWEIEQVCNCFSNPVTIKHEATTPERLRQELSQASHLHWSGHARTENPIEESHFELSDGRRFTVDDILTMNLRRLNLAVLGCCETGMSELDEVIDEYEGLTAAFLSAGAATVVSSLWAVDDAATAYVMKRFYENVYKRAMDKAAALQEAQHWVRQLNRKQAEQLLARSLTLERSQRRLVEHEHIAAERQLHKSFEEAEERTVGRAGLWDHPISWAAFHCVGIGWKTVDSEG